MSWRQNDSFAIVPVTTCKEIPKLTPLHSKKIEKKKNTKERKQAEEAPLFRAYATQFCFFEDYKSQGNVILELSV